MKSVGENGVLAGQEVDGEDREVDDEQNERNERQIAEETVKDCLEALLEIGGPNVGNLLLYRLLLLDYYLKRVITHVA